MITKIVIVFDGSGLVGIGFDRVDASWAMYRQWNFQLLGCRKIPEPVLRKAEIDILWMLSNKWSQFEKRTRFWLSLASGVDLVY